MVNRFSNENTIPHLVLAILQIYFLICFSASSESEGEDGYNLSTQFDEVPVTDSDGEEPVNIDTGNKST